MVTTREIQKLREMTGAGMMDCKRALEEEKGDFEKAIVHLRKKGAESVAKRADKEAKEGIVAAYAHDGRIAAMVEVNCETDFVARNEDFKSFVRDIAMQVAAVAPLYLSKKDVPKDVIEKEKEIEKAKLLSDKKPKEVMEKILTGKMDKYYAQVCLLEQPFIKDDKITIMDLLNEKRIAIGEKIEIKRFVRYELGE